MRNQLLGLVIIWLTITVVSFQTLAQTSPPINRGGTDNLHDKLANTGTGGAAPKKDLTGFWAGLVAPKLNAVAPMTPWGQEQFRLHKNISQFSVAESNDPFKGCDPLGFPRNMLSETRGIAFAQMPGRVIELFQFNRVWREIGTDGKPLPSNAGTDSADAADPRWYGYSVGHWEGDYTFVVDSAGMDERSWLDNVGHPHSNELRVQERYTRIDHNDLEVTISITDAKAYTMPFVITRSSFKWIPRQEFEEQICVPSEQAAYLKIIGDPAAIGPNK